MEFRDELLLSERVKSIPSDSGFLLGDNQSSALQKSRETFFRRSDPIRRCFLATKMHGRVPGIAPFVFVYCVFLYL